MYNVIIKHLTVETLEKKFTKMLSEMRERNNLEEKLSLSVTPEDLTKWEEERQRFESLRIEDPLAGDKVFGGQLTQGM